MAKKKAKCRKLTPDEAEWLKEMHLWEEDKRTTIEELDRDILAHHGHIESHRKHIALLQAQTKIVQKQLGVGVRAVAKFRTQNGMPKKSHL